MVGRKIRRAVRDIDALWKAGHRNVTRRTNTIHYSQAKITILYAPRHQFFSWIFIYLYVISHAGDKVFLRFLTNLYIGLIHFVIVRKNTQRYHWFMTKQICCRNVFVWIGFFQTFRVVGWFDSVNMEQNKIIIEIFFSIWQRPSQWICLYFCSSWYLTNSQNYETYLKR